MKSEPLQPLDRAQRYTIAEACRYLRTSRASLYTKINCGDIRVIRDRSRVYVPGVEIARHSSLDNSVSGLS